MHLSRATFDGLRKAVYQHCGLVVSDDKEYLIRDRLGLVVKQRSMNSLDELCDRLVRGGDQSLVESVIDAVTTQETSFFRDPHVFEALANEVVPRLASDLSAAHGRLRIWSAGVSTGQEAYSLAMLAREFLDGERNASWPNMTFSILGSDISSAALRIARAATYGAREISRGLNATRVRKYFEQAADTYHVRKPIRGLVDFRRVNLAESFTSLGAFELICCRNVLIYFDEATRQRICRQMHSMLTDGGRLILGSAENLYGISNDFVSMQHGDVLIYRKA